jgi:hypothetical protein
MWRLRCEWHVDLGDDGSLVAHVDLDYAGDIEVCRIR